MFQETFLLTENESTYNLVGILKASMNSEKTPLELIKFQPCIYFGEDDIVWFVDWYGNIQ